MNYFILFVICFLVSIIYIKSKKLSNNKVVFYSLAITCSITLSMFIIRGIVDIFLKIIKAILF